MKKFLLAFLLIGILEGENTKNIRGIGIGFTRYGLYPNVIIMKFALSKKTVFEPRIGFYFSLIPKDKNGKKMWGVGLKEIIGYIFKKYEKTNFYIKFGIGFYKYNYKRWYEDEFYFESTLTTEMPLGISFEHFISNYFGINIDLFSTFSYSKKIYKYKQGEYIRKYVEETFTFLASDYNFLFSLIWYY